MSKVHSSAIFWQKCTWHLQVLHATYIMKVYQSCWASEKKFWCCQASLSFSWQSPTHWKDTIIGCATWRNQQQLSGNICHFKKLAFATPELQDICLSICRAINSAGAQNLTVTWGVHKIRVEWLQWFEFGMGSLRGIQVLVWFDSHLEYYWCVNTVCCCYYYY